MASFFEKLTKAEPRQPGNDPVVAPGAVRRPDQPAADDPVETPEAVRRRPGRPRTRVEGEPKTTHLKIETEDTGAAIPEETPAEEEGELTVDIYDKGDEIIIQSTVAGVKPEDLDISITNDAVTIRGRREKHEEVEDKNYYYKELFWGAFSRSVILPEEIDEDLAEANLKNGLLSLRLPKKKRGVVQKLKVKVT